MRIDGLYQMIITEIASAYTLSMQVDDFRRIHTADTWTLCFFPQGEAEYYCDGNRYTANADSVIVIPEGCNYRYQCTQSGQMQVIYFKTLKPPEDNLLSCLKSAGKDKTTRRFAEVLEAKRTGEAPLECMMHLYNLLEMILSGNAKNRYAPKSNYEKIRPAIEYIYRNYHTEISNDLLCELCGLSNQYFRKLFSENCGGSPMAYVTKVRIENAMQILESGEYETISKVAQAVGFADVYHFSKIFKKHTGVSPKNYVKREPKVQE